MGSGEGLAVRCQQQLWGRKWHRWRLTWPGSLFPSLPLSLTSRLPDSGQVLGLRVFPTSRLTEPTAVLSLALSLILSSHLWASKVSLGVLKTAQMPTPCCPGQRGA